MLFPRNALVSGTQAWLGAEKGLFKVKVDNREWGLDKQRQNVGDSESGLNEGIKRGQKKCRTWNLV
jgi:hypothetical protein